MQFRLPYIRSKRWAWLVSLAWSGVFHSFLMGGLLLIVLFISLPERIPVIDTVQAPVTYEGEWTLRSQFEATDVSSESATPASDASPEVDAESSAGELASLIRERLEVNLDRLQEESPEELQKKLDRMGSRLQSVSSEKGVDNVALVLQGTLGIGARTTPDTVPPAEGLEFDFTTAQIDDVRLEAVDGSPRYIALLVDAQGVTLETELDQADGLQLFDTFELMRKYPFMKSVYRKVVMGLMDKMLQPPPAPPVIDSVEETVTLPVP